MLGHREQEASIPSKCSMQLRERVHVLGNVLEHVERPSRVELVDIGKLSGIESQQRRVRDPMGSNLEAGCVDLSADKPELWECGTEPSQDVTRPAANLEKTLRRREVATHRPDD